MSIYMKSPGRAQDIFNRINKKASMLMQGRGGELREAGQFDAVNSGNEGFYAPEQPGGQVPQGGMVPQEEDPLAAFREERMQTAEMQATPPGQNAAIDLLRKKGKMPLDPMSAQAGNDPRLRQALQRVQANKTGSYRSPLFNRPL
jgi:hypothetical protein